MSASVPVSESHFESAFDSCSQSNDRRTSQQKQTIEFLNGKEAREGFGEAEWTINIEVKSDVDRSRLPSDVSIFRVPNILMADTVKKEAYVPRRVSLGPYHHRSAKLPPMDSHKERALHRMMMRFNNVKNLANHMDFSYAARKEIVKLENKIRDSYEEKIDCDSTTLSVMLSLDGCFILEILRALDDRFPGARNYYEPLFERNRIVYTGMDIVNDILKLENQIPFMVLRKLLKLELNSTNDADVEEKLFKVLRRSFLFFFCPFDFKIDIRDFKIDIKKGPFPEADDQEVHHLLGLLHRFIVSPNYHSGEHTGHNYIRLPNQDEDNVVNDVADCNIHPALELVNAGIKFKRCDGGIENIKFDETSGTIYLPPITIEDSTEIVFRNLIAFEMCKPSKFNYVACYVCLMDQLIDSEEDVALLRRKGIVTNCLGSDGEVAKLFNGLCKGVSVSLQDVFDRLTQKVNGHYNNEFKVHCAELVKMHFSSPWKTLGLVAAIVLLMLTTVQTIFAILTLYK